MLGTESLSLENPARPDEKDVATEVDWDLVQERG